MKKRGRPSLKASAKNKKKVREMLAEGIAIVDIALVILSGLALWKSVQFPLLRTLMGGYDNARVVHFFAMSVLLAFFVVHVIMVALVPRSLLLMIRGH